MSRRLGFLLRLRLLSLSLAPGFSRGVLLLRLRLSSGLRRRSGLQVRPFLCRGERSLDLFRFSCPPLPGSLRRLCITKMLDASGSSWAAFGPSFRWCLFGLFAESSSSGFPFASGLPAGGRRSTMSGGGSVKHNRLLHSVQCLYQYGNWISHSMQYPCVGIPSYFSS